MKKTLAISLTATFLLGLSGGVSGAALDPGGSSKRRQHVVRHDYNHPDGIRIADHWGRELIYLLPNLNNISFQPRPSDRYIRLEFDDASGGHVFADVYQDPGDKRSEPLEVNICEPRHPVIPLVSRERVEVRIYAGLCHNHNWSFASRGTIIATFSNRR